MTELGSRVVGSLLLLLGVFAAIAATGWAVEDGRLVPWALAVAVDLFALAWAVVMGVHIGGLFAQMEQERAEAERRWVEAERLSGLDLDGDGVVGRVTHPERIVWLKDYRQDSDGGMGFQTVANVLRLAYDSGGRFGQADLLGDVTRPEYDYALSVLTGLGLVDGRKRGEMGRLVLDTYAQAIERLRAAWNEGQSERLLT